MTILLVDFPSGQPGRYGGSNALLNEIVYSHGGLFDDPRVGADGQGKTWGLGNSTNLYMELGLPDVFQRFVFSFRIWMETLPPELSLSTVFQLWEDNDESGFDIQIYPDGSFGNTDPCIVTGAWQLVEVMMGAGVAYDHLIIRVDGEEIINSPGGTIHRPEPPAQPAYFWRINNSGAPSFCLIKDFVLQYGHSADFIGPANVRELVPVADVSSGWTKVGGASEYGILDNSPPDDAQYIVAADPIPAPSVTTLAGLHPSTIAIHGLFPSYRMNSENGGSVQGSLVNGGTPRDGDDIALDATRRFYSDTMVVDPATGDPWDPAVVAALTLSLNRTS